MNIVNLKKISMTDKEKAIKEAWGDFYNLGVGIDENGWLRGDYLENKTKDILKTKDCIEVKRRAMHDLGFYDSSIEIFRPISLQGIENNNGWFIVKERAGSIEYKGDIWVVTKQGEIELIKEEDFIPVGYATHFKPIYKPTKLPIY